MKRFLLYLLTIAAFVACSKGEDEGNDNSEPTPEKPKTEIKIDTSTSDFTTEGGDNTISFTTNEAWTAQVINSRADDWCKINPTSGSAGNATITVTTTPNDTPDDRTASIIIKAGAVSKTVTVSQKQKDALTITASKFEVAAAGGEVAIEVKANIDFEYVIDDDAKEWISYEGTRALKTSKLAFKIAENDDIEKREGQIFIKNGELVEAVTIYQDGAEPSIVISKNEYVVSSDGETISVEVKSNVDVAIELTAEADWISENTSRATSTNTYRFDISPNESYDQRSAEIKFTNKENNLSEVVRVTQTQKNALVVAKDSYTVDSEGDQIQIEIGHNVDFDIEIANDWITKVDTRAFTTETLTFNIATNTTNDSREGTIIFKSKDGKLTQIVKIYQAQEDTLIISKKDIVIDDKGGTVEFEIQTNVEFSVSNPDVAWVCAISTRGLTTHTLRYEVDANTSYDSREAKIIVTDTKNNKSETITITQAQKDAIVLAKDSYSVDSEGGQIQIEVGHNVDFDIEISDDWITKADTRAFVTETLNFNIAKNGGCIAREGAIIFSSQNHKISQVVKIIQREKQPAANEIVIEFVSSTYYSEDEVNVMLANAFGGYISSYSYSDGVCVISLNNACTSIPEKAFYCKNGIKKVVLGKNVTKIENRAFYECSSISTILMEGVKTIEDSAFFGTGLTDIELPNTLETIGEGAFQSLDYITHINIPKNVTKIGERAFAGCGALESITFDADNVEFIGDICDLFANCENLSAFYGKCASNDNRCLIINNSLYSFIPKGLTEYSIPHGVTKLEDSAFILCNYINNKISIILTDEVIDIGNSFNRIRNISSIAIGKGITSIREGAFKNCTDLESITMGECVASIGINAFPPTLTKVNITNLSAWCNIEFENDSSHPFGGIKTEMGDLYIKGEKVSELTIASDITEIKSYAFYGCSLTNVTLENGITSIGKRAFYNCRSLEKVTIPNSVTMINEQAFSAYRKVFATDDENSTEYYNWDQDPIYIYIKAEIPPVIQGDIKEAFRYYYHIYKPWGSLWEESTYRKYTIYVPAAVLNDYKTKWSEIGSHINGYYF